MLDLNTIHQGDCLDLMQHIPDGSIDMVLCDLPYGTTRNRWDSIIPLDAMWEGYKRIIKPTGAIVLTASQPFTSVLVSSNLPWFRDEWIWLKNRGSNFANTVREPFKEHESVLVFGAGKWTYNGQAQKRTGGGADRVKTDIKSYGNSDNYGQHTQKRKVFDEMRKPSSWQKFNTEVGLHPTQKPVALFEYLIRTYTNPGEVVLDCCMGSGTTAIAALNTGRQFIGIEREAEYVDVANRRLSSRQNNLQFA